MTDTTARNPPPAGRILLTQETIAARVRQLGVEITEHYRGQRPLFLGVMNGALFFLTDLLREVDLETEISCIRLASYAGTKSTGRLSGLHAMEGDSFQDRTVLIVDDILDTGHTLAELVRRLHELGASDVKVCVLLHKERHRDWPSQADWIGFTIADEFVVGYGLDHDGRYRGLRDIWALG